MLSTRLIALIQDGLLSRRQIYEDVWIYVSDEGEVFTVNWGRTAVDGYYLSERAYFACFPMPKGRTPKANDEQPTEEKPRSVRTVSGGLPGFGKRR
jgi:hypothetical protein